VTRVEIVETDNPLSLYYFRIDLQIQGKAYRYVPAVSRELIRNEYGAGHFLDMVKHEIEKAILEYPPGVKNDT
jgi:hypothetical protein